MSEGTASKLMFVIVQLGLVLAMFASLALDDIQLGVLFQSLFDVEQQEADQKQNAKLDVIKGHGSKHG